MADCVEAADIDVGPSCSLGSTAVGGGHTVINKDNPANDSGTIDCICYSQESAGSDTADFASFTDEGSDTLSTNGAAQGLATAEGVNDYYASSNDFTAFNISSGEYIGRYSAGQADGVQSGAGGIWNTASDQITCASFTFNATLTTWGINLYATGSTAVGGLSIPVAMHHRKQQGMS